MPFDLGDATCHAPDSIGIWHLGYLHQGRVYFEVWSRWMRHPLVGEHESGGV